MKPLFGREIAEKSQKTWKLKEKCLSLHRQSPPRFPSEQRTRVELFFIYSHNEVQQATARHSYTDSHAERAWPEYR